MWGGWEYGCHFAFLLFGGHQANAAESVHVLRHPCKIAKEKQLFTARVFPEMWLWLDVYNLESAQSITYHQWLAEFVTQYWVFNVLWLEGHLEPKCHFAFLKSEK